jgi:hypothetical protein
MPKKKADKNDKPYTGMLAQPMAKWSIFDRPTNEEIDALIEEKFKALFEHFGIDQTEAFRFGPKKASAWANLAFSLAHRHVPGFRGPPRERGRPPERKLDDSTLFLHVELLKRREGLSKSKAIKVIANQGVVEGTQSALDKRYKRAKPQFEGLHDFLDIIEAHFGKHKFVKMMELSLARGKKDSILSPG